MRQLEFESWVQFVRGAFANFNPAKSELMMDAWKEALKGAGLEQAKTAVKQYVVEVSSKFEPQPKDIKNIIEANKPEEVVASADRVELDFPEKRFHEDIVLGCCRHNLYIYREAYRVYGVNDFNKSLELVSLKRNGKVAEFPSNRELEEKGINPHAKVPLEDAKALLDVFYKKCCQL